MKPVFIAALAEDELREARDWYDQQAPGLGVRLVEALDTVFEQIAESPQRFPVVCRDVHRALVRRFPYGVFFREQPEYIRVIAVVHLHRHPDTWKRRR